MANAASYRYDLGNSQIIHLSNQGILTTVTFSSSGAGQQQQSSQGVSTGQWTAPPELYQLGGGFVAAIFAQQMVYLSIQGTQIQMSVGGAGIAQQISGLEPLPMEIAEPSATAHVQPIMPMQPMKMTMGNMNMSMGEMRMGDMTLSSRADSQTHASTESSAQSSAKKKFCSQCGTAVEASDRFCAQCGHKLL